LFVNSVKKRVKKQKLEVLLGYTPDKRLGVWE